MRPATHGRTHLPKNLGGTDPIITIHTLLAVFDGGGSALTTGIKGDVQLHQDFKIKSWTLLADQAGSIVVDIWKDTYGNYPPTDADSITGGAEPEISSDDQATSATLTGWDVDYLAGETLRFNIDSVSALTRVTLALELRSV